MDKELISRILLLWQIRVSLILFVWIVSCGFAMFFSYILSVSLMALAVLIYITAMAIYLPRFSKSYKIIRSNDSIEIYRGVIFTQHIILNSNKIQSREYSQLPLQKILKLQTVHLKTACRVICYMVCEVIT